ncbi:hypothetical protein DL89DRAFT_148311 [Linderina pennispora]|uniref:Uncharacterized protein n=1 Tax=Linderina pennispora TaxID=61395 RepID=A0A1Y1VUC4_9FUNG|nr:uncharacterized protein DL89DRAFT_148311 [Linderina pennispora]ORX64881.1 hypothetical protein DL89DRAFT_148311 [Linderina pennispora]
MPACLRSGHRFWRFGGGAEHGSKPQCTWGLATTNIPLILIWQASWQSCLGEFASAAAQRLRRHIHCSAAFLCHSGHCLRNTHQLHHYQQQLAARLAEPQCGNELADNL